MLPKILNCFDWFDRKEVMDRYDRKEVMDRYEVAKNAAESNCDEECD